MSIKILGKYDVSLHTFFLIIDDIINSYFFLYTFFCVIGILVEVVIIHTGLYLSFASFILCIWCPNMAEYTNILLASLLCICYVMKCLFVSASQTFSHDCLHIVWYCLIRFCIVFCRFGRFWAIAPVHHSSPWPKSQKGSTKSETPARSSLSGYIFNWLTSYSFTCLFCQTLGTVFFFLSYHLKLQFVCFFFKRDWNNCIFVSFFPPSRQKKT